MDAAFSEDPIVAFFCLWIALDTCVFIACLNTRNASSGFWSTICGISQYACFFLFSWGFYLFQLHFAVWGI